MADIVSSRATGPGSINKIVVKSNSNQKKFFDVTTLGAPVQFKYYESLLQDVIHASVTYVDPGNAVKPEKGEAEFTTAVDLYTIAPEPALEPSINVDTADFQSDLELLDSNVQKTGNHITLKYEEVEMFNQPLASRVENVNPFNMIEIEGIIRLNPDADAWTRTINTASSDTRVVVGAPIVLEHNTRIPRRNDRYRVRRRGWFRRLLFGRRNGGWRQVPGLDIGGGQRLYQEDVQGDRALVQSYIETIQGPITADTHIRSRNVAFDAFQLRPLQRHYAFFDNTSGIDIVPKLIEISMTSGSFVIGETVKGYIGGNHVFSARAYRPNHKTGPTARPFTRYTLNPYDRSVELPSVYSSSSTILNLSLIHISEPTRPY